MGLVFDADTDTPHLFASLLSTNNSKLGGTIYYKESMLLKMKYKDMCLFKG